MGKNGNLAILVVVCAIFLLSGIVTATTVTIAPSDDLWVVSDQPNANLGTNMELRVGPEASGRINRSILKFNLSAVPEGQVITSVKLYLYERQAAENTTDFYDVYTASGTGVTTWDDATATWNSTQPNWTYTLAENDEVNITAAGWYHWDITTSLSRTDVVTFGLLSKVETSDTNQRAFFYSTHGGTSTQVQPYLEVTYEAVPEPTTAMLLLGIGCVRVFCKNGF